MEEIQARKGLGLEVRSSQPNLSRSKKGIDFENKCMKVKGLLAVAGYCSTDDTRPVITGVALYLGEKLAVAGADGFRLAYQEIPGNFTVLPAREGVTNTVIIPTRAISVLGHLWKKAPGLPAEGFPARLLKRKLALALGEDRLQAHFGRVTVITRLIAGTPPNHRQFIPQEAPLQVKLRASRDGEGGAPGR